ncbi:MAG: spherulation-specific family 4 protein [Spirochaetales bacterium]|nr:spherulation-specific family 4 protein [Spirochaetales bacterium]
MKRFIFPIILLTGCVSLNIVVYDVPNGLIIPLYVYPTNNNSYSKVLEYSRNNPHIPVIVILNPNSGPGENVDLNYKKAIKELKQPNITTIGYVSTNYTLKKLEDVKNSIKKWKEFYPDVKGIFLDEMTSESTFNNINYYKELNIYTKQLGFTTTVANPGRPFSNNYFTQNCADIIIGWEESEYPSPKDYQIYNVNRVGVLIHSQEIVDIKMVKKISRKYKWIYITQDKLENPWDSLSNHMDSLYSALNTF